MGSILTLHSQFSNLSFHPVKRWCINNMTQSAYFHLRDISRLHPSQLTVFLNMLWLHLALIIVILSSVLPHKRLQRLVQNAAPHVITRTFPQNVLFLSSNSFACSASYFHICLQSHTSKSLIFSHTPLLPVLRDPPPLLPLLYYVNFSEFSRVAPRPWISQHWSLSLTYFFLSLPVLLILNL